MPSIDSGWLVIEVADVLELNLTETKKLVEWVLSNDKALLVTSPSPVYVESESEYSSLAIVLGVGSLAIKGTLNIPLNLRTFRLFRREWIDGCWVSRDPNYEFLTLRESVRIKSTSSTLTLKDPVALLSNGIWDVHEFFRADEDLLKDYVPLVKINNDYVVFRDGRKYLSTMIRGILRKILEYIMPLASACNSSP